MFKPFPDVVASQGCGNVRGEEYDINWEEIARWALEHGELDDSGSHNRRGNDVAANNGPAIDWCEIADSFMRDEAAGNEASNCNPNEINESMRSHDHPCVRAELNHPSESGSRMPIQAFGEFASPIPNTRRPRYPKPPSPPRRRAIPTNLSYSGNSELNRSMRDSDYDNTTHADFTPLSSIHGYSQGYSFLDDSLLKDSRNKSDIMDYLESGQAERNRPNSLVEGYHFSGRSYGRPDFDVDHCPVFTSTPKKPNQRTTRAETFEYQDGCKIFNITVEEILGIGSRLRHISDLRDYNGCQIMSMDREINEAPNGTKHRVDIARRWLNLDQDQDGAGCS